VKPIPRKVINNKVIRIVSNLFWASGDWDFSFNGVLNLISLYNQIEARQWNPLSQCQFIDGPIRDCRSQKDMEN